MEAGREGGTHRPLLRWQGTGDLLSKDKKQTRATVDSSPVSAGPGAQGQEAQVLVLAPALASQNLTRDRPRGSHVWSLGPSLPQPYPQLWN